jgi:hypothetical protein
MLVVDCGLINRKGEIAWSRVARALVVSVSLLRRWRSPQDKAYKPEFRQAGLDAGDAVQLGKIKLSMIRRAQDHTEVTKITELRETPDGDITVNRSVRTKKFGDVAAAKFVAGNLGPPEERWTDKHDHVITDDRLSHDECEKMRAILQANLGGDDETA